MRVIRMQTRQALTRIEMMVVIAVISIAALLFLPALARFKAKASRVKCVNNLKNLGVAFRIFAMDHSDRFPFELSESAGGTLELTNDIIAQFRVLSNELFLPILNCPTRTIRQPPAHDWSTLAHSKISWYVALTARTALPKSILSGDAGFSVDGALATNRIVHINPASRIEYPSRFHEDADAANIVMSDGSVSGFSANGFARWQRISPVTTNSFLVP